MGTRDNNFGDNKPDCGGKGGNVEDRSSATCENVYSKGTACLSRAQECCQSHLCINNASITPPFSDKLNAEGER